MSLFEPSTLLVFLAGLLSSFSPCVLPVLPGFLAFLAGTHVRDLEQDRPHLMRRVLLFCAGLVLAFAALGALSGSLGAALLAGKMWIERAAGIAFILWGLGFLGLIRIPVLAGAGREERAIRGGLGAFLFGATFALTFSPCIGPILGAVLTLAAYKATVWKGTLLLIAYGLGASVPFLILAFFLSRIRRFLPRLAHYERRIRVGTGIVLIVVGLFLAVNGSSAFGETFLRLFPEWIPPIA